MQEVEQANDEFRLRRERLVRGIRKMRLERAILLEALSKRMQKGRLSAGEGYDDDTEDSTDSPPTVSHPSAANYALLPIYTASR